MRLTLASDLGFRTLLYLGGAGARGGTIPDIAAAYRVSEHHLRKVVAHLAGLGLIDATRGRNGGLRLARPPETIGLGWLLRQTEADFALLACFGDEPQACVLTGGCGLQGIMAEALAAFLAVLDRYTLADALNRSTLLAGLLARPADFPDRTGADQL